MIAKNPGNVKHNPASVDASNDAPTALIVELTAFLEEVLHVYLSSNRRDNEAIASRMTRGAFLSIAVRNLRALVRRAKRLRRDRIDPNEIDKLIETVFLERRVLRSTVTLHPRYPGLASAAQRLGQELCQTSSNAKRLSAGAVLQICGSDPAELLEFYESNKLRTLISDKHCQLLGLDPLDARKLLTTATTRIIDSKDGLVAYIAAMSLPYKTNGYSSRTEGVALGYASNGIRVEVITRPGFPLNVLGKKKNTSDIKPVENLNGITYHRILEPPVEDRKYTAYARKAADALEAKLRELEPEYVISASNFEISVPALIAARRLGLPFHYEMRGMWELTRASENPGFEKTARYAVMQEMERFVCSQADRVLILTQGMKNKLVASGIDAEKIALMPNGVNAEMLRSETRDIALAEKLGISRSSVVVGYAGAIKGYEGLQDLATSVARLAGDGVDVVLLMLGKENSDSFGHTPITEKIKDAFERMGKPDRLVMVGRVPFDDMKRYYSIMDICPITRRGYAVSELVSPIKPVEALAQAKAVLLSDVEAMKFFSQNETTALLYRKGDTDHLTEKLRLLIEDERLRLELGRSGKQFVEKNLLWSKICQDAARHIGMV